MPKGRDEDGSSRKMKWLRFHDEHERMPRVIFTAETRRARRKRQFKSSPCPPCLCGDTLAFLSGHIAATPQAASAPSTTTAQGGTRQNASSRKAAAARMKSAGAWMALVQTGV